MRQCINVNIIDDTVTENEEEFRVLIEAATSGVELIATSTAVFITDNEGNDQCVWF